MASGIGTCGLWPTMYTYKHNVLRYLGVFKVCSNLYLELLFVCSVPQIFLTDPVLRIRNSEFWIRGASSDPDPDPTRAFLWQLKKNML